jgi:O-antigen/teichoic acid export membrane protein
MKAVRDSLANPFGMSTVQESAEAMEAHAVETTARNLKRNTTRGALISLTAQGMNFVLRTGSLMVLARLLTPKDFGLVGMAAAATGILNIIKDAGLGWAMVQRDSITQAQASTLFWINLALGAALTALCALLSPAIAAFYAMPALVWINVALGISFFFNGASAQHRAILQRNMRFGTIAIIDMAALAASILIAIAMAVFGQRYWALVAMSVSQIGFSAAGVWAATRWVPGWPERASGIRSMIMFGSTVTISNLISYLAFNMDKVLLGRFWGADALGIYGRAYTLSSVPNENVNSAIASVAFPALSRLQNEPLRFKDYFLQGYGLFISLVLPITVWCALLSDDIIRVMLGPKWHEAATILRWLAPTIACMGLIQPFSWLMLAMGRAGRSFRISLALAPVVILGYSIGLAWGPRGVAAGFSISLGLMIVPAILRAKRGTLITGGDVLKAVGPPLGAITLASAGLLLCQGLTGRILQTVPRLMVESAILLGLYMLVLIFVMNQKQVYAGVLREMQLWPFRKKSAEAASPVF